MVTKPKSLGYSVWLAVVFVCFGYSYFALERVLPQELSVFQAAIVIGVLVLAGITMNRLINCLTWSLRGEPMVEAGGEWRVALYSFTGCLILFAQVLSRHLPADDAYPTTLVNATPAIFAVVVSALVSRAIRPRGV